MSKKAQWFGDTATCAKAASATLTLTPQRRGALGRLVVSAGAGDPATVGAVDVLPLCAVTAVTIQGDDYINGSVAAEQFAKDSLAPQPWYGRIVDTSTPITMTIANNAATLATAAQVTASFEAHE